MKKQIRFSALADHGIHYTRAHLSRMIEAGQFPQPIKLGTGNKAHIAFVESEIDDWIESRLAARKELALAS